MVIFSFMDEFGAKPVPGHKSLGDGTAVVDENGQTLLVDEIRDMPF